MSECASPTATVAARREPARPAASTLWLDGLAIEATTLDAAARHIVDHCLSREPSGAAPPLYITSVNGHVLSLRARDASFRRLLAEADIIHCDGQPLVLLSRGIGRVRLPERVSTTDLFPRVAARAAANGLSFYLLGGTPDTSGRLPAVLRESYPGLVVAGASHGYLSSDEEARVVGEIAALRPDVLWVAMGVPLEQAFVTRHRAALRGVGVIKTAGGLFDFLTGGVPRAPLWMQTAGLEWLFRVLQEPHRLFWRYAVSNPHAVYLSLRGLYLGRRET